MGRSYQKFAARHGRLDTSSLIRRRRELSLSSSVPAHLIKVLESRWNLFDARSCLDPRTGMKTGNLKSNLRKEKEIELTVTGRKSKKLIPRPVWFAHKETDLLLLPVTGTNSQWYKTTPQNPQEKITSSRQTLAGKDGKSTHLTSSPLV